MTTDLLQHAKDADTVARYLKRKRFGPIYAVGHSFGGLTLLASDNDTFRAMSLWDCSSFISYPPNMWFRKDATSGAFYFKGSFELLLSSRFRRGIQRFPDELSLAAKVQIPTQLCYAAGPEGMLIESSKRYFEHLACSRSLEAIPGASHSFTEEGVGEVLFRKTLKWFRRF
jgi:pimeloyl-ACP methyl ester carboxylesterase